MIDSYGIYELDELAVISKADDSAFSELLVRMLPMIRRKAGKYSLPGLDSDDIIQEGILGLLYAVRHFDPVCGSFANYSSVCISSRLKNITINSFSSKQRPLRDYTSLDDADLTCAGMSPEDEIVENEMYSELCDRIVSTLSDYELKVLLRYLNGLSYAQISSLLHTSVKAVDNAMQRIRRKLRSI